jgi:hypothetical protein
VAAAGTANIVFYGYSMLEKLAQIFCYDEIFIIIPLYELNRLRRNYNHKDIPHGGTSLRASKAQRNHFLPRKTRNRNKKRSQRMNAVTPHAFTDYMYFLHYLHVPSPAG